MKLTKAAVVLCFLVSFQGTPARATPSRSIKGVVITPDGTIVPEFSVVVRHIADKPDLVRRFQFTNGEFLLQDLSSENYELQIASPLFVGAKVLFNLKDRSRATDYCIVVLHPYRTESRLSPGAAYSAPSKLLEQKIPPAAKEAYARGTDFHREGKLDSALIEYGKALRSYPQYLAALTDIGAIFLLYDRPDSALTFLRRAHDVDESNEVVNLNIAVALAEKGDYNGALNQLKGVVQRQPQMAFVEYAIARIAYAQRKYDEAEQHVRKAVEVNPALLDAWVLLIDISLEQKKTDQAREALEQIRKSVNVEMVTEFIDEQLSALGSS